MDYADDGDVHMKIKSRQAQLKSVVTGLEVDGRP